MNKGTARLRDLFSSRPNEWIPLPVVAQVGGCGGFSKRIHECRTELGMNIVNRTVTVEGHSKHSEYRYVPESVA